MRRQTFRFVDQTLRFVDHLGFPILLVIVAAAYLWRLGDAPIYLAADEAIIANDAYAVATTGRALNGTFLPLYFPAGIYNSWFMPLIYYAIAGVLQVLPLAEWSIRVPTALAGVFSIALLYLVGRRLYSDRIPAVIAALVLACSPAFFILSRYALDYTLPIPFLLGWLWCLSIAFDSSQAGVDARPSTLLRAAPSEVEGRRWFAAAGLCLGVGWYAYISSIVMMPVYVVMTVVIMAARKRDWRDIAAFITAFLLPLTLFVVWLMQHPEAIAATARRYGLIEAAQAASAGSMLQTFDGAAMLSRYLNFFRFDFLFQLGDTYLPFSTRNTGVFVGAAGVLIAAGIIAALSTYRSAMALLVLAGFLISPLAASVLQEEGAIRRASGMLAFGALLAGFGAALIGRIARVPFFKQLAVAAAVVGLIAGAAVMARTAMTQGRISETAARVIVIAIVAAIIARLSTPKLQAPSPKPHHGWLIVAPIVLVMTWQFVTFQRSYHGEYMSRLTVWLHGNVRGAIQRLIAESDARPQAPIYFATLRNGQGGWEQRNLYIPHYWRFYTTRFSREHLQQRAVFVDIEADPLTAVPEGSLMFANVEDPNVRRLLADGAERIADIPEVDRAPFYTIVVR
jgi:4-amino-4-deoxy-L-arabinose transferase-like glycosyltransferase